MSWRWPWSVNWRLLTIASRVCAQTKFFRCLILVLTVFASSQRASTDPLQDKIFDGTLIPNLRIEISPAGVASLAKEPRKYVLTTLWEGGRAYTNVAIHLKAGVGSFSPISDKPALTLNIDKFAPGQRFHGLAKLHLNNSAQDSSYLKEKISRELFEKAGVLTPRAGHAVVELNGRKLGLYILLEGVDRRFLARRFQNTKGNVYDGYSSGDIDASNPPLKVISGSQRDNRSGLIRLANAVEGSSLQTIRANLRNSLDIDQFLSFMAMEVILDHHDGYSLDVNNYRMFHNLESDRMVFIPHGMDLMFETPSAPIDRKMQGLVAVRVMEDPELRLQYLERVAQLTTNVINVSVITNRVYDIARRIEPQLAHGFGKSSEAFRHEVEQVVQFFVQRSDYLRGSSNARKPQARPE